MKFKRQETLQYQLWCQVWNQAYFHTKGQLQNQLLNQMGEHFAYRVENKLWNWNYNGR